MRSLHRIPRSLLPAAALLGVLGAGASGAQAVCPRPSGSPSIGEITETPKALELFLRRRGCGILADPRMPRGQLLTEARV